MRIDHVLVLAKDVAAMRAFMVDVIGFEDGYRPPFPFPGHWLYSNGIAQIHLAGRVGEDDQARYLSHAGCGDGRGTIDHLALTGADFPALMTRLERSGIDHAIRRIPAENHVQVFVLGPEGVTFEMLFPETALPSNEQDIPA